MLMLKVSASYKKRYKIRFFALQIYFYKKNYEIKTPFVWLIFKPNIKK